MSSRRPTARACCCSPRATASRWLRVAAGHAGTKSCESANRARAPATRVDVGHKFAIRRQSRRAHLQVRCADRRRHRDIEPGEYVHTHNMASDHLPTYTLEAGRQFVKGGERTITSYLRSDGRKGIRNNIVVTYLVECAHHVAREIVHPFSRAGREPDRLLGLLSQRLLAQDDGAAVHSPERRRRAAGVAGLRGLQQERAARRPSGNRVAPRAWW